jgi:hypothetical protein
MFQTDCVRKRINHKDSKRVDEENRLEEEEGFSPLVEMDPVVLTSFAGTRSFTLGITTMQTTK